VIDGGPRGYNGHAPRYSPGAARILRKLDSAPVDVTGPERLGPARRLLLAAEIVATYVRVRLALRRMPIEAAIEQLRGARAMQPAEPGQQSPAERRAARRLARATVVTLSVLPADARCLYRSVVLSSLLARRSIGSSIVIGARTEPKFEAHAWVECAGRPLLPDSGFARLTDL
jgi:hypothetical protein